MRKTSIAALFVTVALLLSSCSPRDYLTRRLAADLIATSKTFLVPQLFQLRLGLTGNKDFLSHDYIVLQHRGWISGSNAPCTPALAPPPCWDVMLTPSGVDTVQTLIAPGDVEKLSLNISTAKRELVAVTGIARQGTLADVEFTWRWVPLNEVGAALYPGDLRFSSTASFRCYDDGWRIVEGATRPGQPMDEALKSAEPAP
jgi:hypothetical protein